MASRREAMKERLKGQMNQTNRQPDSEDSDKEVGSEDTLNRPTAMEIGDETEDAERLARSLKNKRKKVQSEVTRETEEKTLDEDVIEKMKLAQQRAGERVKDEMAESSVRPGSETPGASTADLRGQEPGDTSAPATARSTTPRSSLTPRKSGLNTTLRAKMLETIRAAKEQGKDEAYKGHKLAGERSKQKTTRFDDGTHPIHEEDDLEERDDPLEKSVSMKVQLRNLAQKAEQEIKKDIPTEQEQVDFFFRVFDLDDEKDEKKEEKEMKEVKVQEPQPEMDREEPGSARDEEPKASEAVEEDESKKKKAKLEEEEPLLDDMDDVDEFSWMPYQVGKASYVSFQDRLKNEEELYFFPSMIEAPIEKKVFTSDQQPLVRNIADEGFYVGERPFVSPRNLNRMENRLLKEIRVGKDEEEAIVLADSKLNNAKKWFGEDGRLITLPDPVKEVSSRPLIIEQMGHMFVTEYQKAHLRESNIMSVEGRFQLDIDVNTIVFLHHHMFSKEHVLASQLTRQYEEYLSRAKKQVTEYLTGKLQALKSAQCHVEENIQGLEAEDGKESALADQRRRLKEYKDEIRVARKQRDYEMQVDRLLMRNIIQTWKDIKTLRKNQNCTNTSVKLSIIKEEVDKALDERELEDDIIDEVNEIREDNDEKYSRDLDEYNKQLALWKDQKARKKEAKKKKVPTATLR